MRLQRSSTSTTSPPQSVGLGFTGSRKSLISLLRHQMYRQTPMRSATTTCWWWSSTPTPQFTTPRSPLRANSAFVNVCRPSFMYVRYGHMRWDGARVERALMPPLLLLHVFRAFLTAPSCCSVSLLLKLMGRRSRQVTVSMRFVMFSERLPPMAADEFRWRNHKMKRAQSSPRWVYTTPIFTCFDASTSSPWFGRRLSGTISGTSFTFVTEENTICYSSNGGPLYSSALKKAIMHVTVVQMYVSFYGNPLYGLAKVTSITYPKT